MTTPCAWSTCTRERSRPERHCWISTIALKPETVERRRRGRNRGACTRTARGGRSHSRRNAGARSRAQGPRSTRRPEAPARRSAARGARATAHGRGRARSLRERRGAAACVPASAACTDRRAHHTSIHRAEPVRIQTGGQHRAPPSRRENDATGVPGCARSWLRAGDDRVRAFTPARDRSFTQVSSVQRGQVDAAPWECRQRRRFRLPRR
jgi:hypothetical protein